MSTPSDLPVAVIGVGPVGLAAAAHLVTRGIRAKLYEAGETIGANVRSWGHVRLFSPWRFNTDAASKAILLRHGWQEPPGDVLPTLDNRLCSRHAGSILPNRGVVLCS